MRMFFNTVTVGDRSGLVHAVRARAAGVCIILLVGCGSVEPSSPPDGAVMIDAASADASADVSVDAGVTVTVGGNAGYLPAGRFLTLVLKDGQGAAVGNPLVVTADGPFTFDTGLPASGASYRVEVSAAPAGSTCWLADRGSGVTSGAAVTSLVARCVKAVSAQSTTATVITSAVYPASQTAPVIPVASLTLPAAADVFVTLSVPYTSGAGTNWDNSILWGGVRDGLAEPALIAARRMTDFNMGGPLQLAGVIRLGAGTHDLEGVFRVEGASGVNLAASARLTVVVLDSLSTYARHVGQSVPSLFSTISALQQIAILDVTLAADAPALVYGHVPNSAGIATVPDTWTSGDVALMDGAATVAIAGHDTGSNDVRVATTLVGGRRFTAGVHRLRLDATCSNNGSTACSQLVFGAQHLKLGLIELTPSARLNIAATSGTGMFDTGSRTFVPMDNDGGANDLSTTITLTEARQALVTLSTQRIRSTQNGNGLRVGVFLDGALLEPAVIFDSPNSDRGVSMPSYALVTLAPGTHTFDVRWNHSNQNSLAVAASVPRAGNVLTVLVLE